MAALILPMRHLVLAVLLAGMAAAASAQEDTAPEVEVRGVKFSIQRPALGGDGWLEALVELNVRGAGGGGPYARYSDRVRVTLDLSIRRRNGEFEFYRASAEAVSLEAGRATLRFYLPPEVVKREQVNSDPHAYQVELAVRGRPVPGFVSGILRAEEALRSFRDRVAQAGPANDGVLVPQHESPFADAYPGDTPSVVRRPR